jgi:hypothetical protein
MSSPSSLPSPPSSRRSSRISSRPSRYDEEQLSCQIQQQDERDLQQAIQESLERDVDDSTDEDISPIDLGSEEEEEQKQQPIVEKDIEWTTAVHKITPVPFAAPFGPTRLRQSRTSPLDLFQVFLPPSLVQHLADCTNEYASSKIAVEWTPTNTSELYCFIGLLVYMGIDHLPQLPMYWSGLYSHTFVSAAMSRDRFQQLVRYFHVSSQAQQQQNSDRLKKVRWFSQQLQKIFASHYNPSQVLTVDEAMVPFKGRSQIKQYIAQKPTKWGYKIWCLVSDGYLLEFEIYEGKSSSPESSVGSDVVLRLTRPYQHNNHIVYLDRFFSSPYLLDELLQVGIRACGTVRKDRVGLPATYKSIASEMQKGELRYWQRQELGALVWKDRRAVYMITTHISPAEVKYIERRDSSKQVAVPAAVLDYNKYKSGVDTIDQMRQSYSIGRKSKKWWPNLVWWLIDMCILNAYSLYNQQQQVKIRQLEFRQELMQQLVEQYSQERSHVGRPSCVPYLQPQQGHYPQHIPQQHDCVRCRAVEQRRARTNFQCKLCHAHLCIDPCFELHHINN